MDQFLKNQKYVFILIFGGLVLVAGSWYFFLHQGLSKQYKRSKQVKRSLSSDVSKYRRMESQIAAMQTEWDTLSTEFGTVIERIPDKREFEIVTDYLYSLILNHGLKIQTFSPSEASIEKKTILLPETGNEILVEKFPIDIILKGSFINFGKLLEAMKTSRYRYTASNIEIIQKESLAAQTIQLMSYAYFRTVNNKPLAQSERSVNKNPKPSVSNSFEKKVEVEGKKQKSSVSGYGNKIKTKNNKEQSNVSNKNSILPDSIKGVPEMWLEPATEPIDETVLVTELKPEKKPAPVKQNKKESVPTPALKKEKPAKTPDTIQDFHSIVILGSQVCKKVKNNQPIYPGKRFPNDIGRVYCHSLLNNNTGKHNDIYHIWYMNGELKAKVRIRVRDGKEIPAVSHRAVASSDKGIWKIEITDSDKKILDTLIFEVV